MNNQNAHTRALLQTHVSILLLAGTALFSKIIPLNAAAISTGRAVIACLLLACIVQITESSLRLKSKKDYVIGCILGVLMALHWVTYFYAMQYSTVAIGMIALYTFPVLTVFIEPLFNKKMPRINDIMLAVIVFSGVALMVPELSFASDYTVGIALGVISALFFALRNILNKRHFTQYSGMKNMMFQAFIIAICLLPFEFDTLVDINSDTFFLLLLLGSLFTALPHVLLVNGLKFLQAKSMSLIACLSPVYGALLAYILLSETLNWQTMLGGGVVLSTAIFETVSLSRRKV
ncbi:DMT family transporter [Algibacillus agarilyticus]|uniref:DMT family transporter n=1 Tax=Algibacillus agarilyticus TaxID=2234133 RepID=UPI000DD01933|nr:DMT family transporter [Algibacillus agarilyticus]